MHWWTELAGRSYLVKEDVVILRSYGRSLVEMRCNDAQTELNIRGIEREEVTL